MHSMSYIYRCSKFKGFTDEQRELQQTLRKFTKDEVIPVAAHHDETGEFPWGVIKKAHAAGILNGNIPAAYGPAYFFSKTP